VAARPAACVDLRDVEAGAEVVVAAGAVDEQVSDDDQDGACDCDEGLELAAASDQPPVPFAEEGLGLARGCGGVAVADTPAAAGNASQSAGLCRCWSSLSRDTPDLPADHGRTLVGDLTMYELNDPTAEADLAADAARGVDVRAVLDQNLGKASNAAAYAYLAAHGCTFAGARPTRHTARRP
jgi:hypothetical protein